MNVSEMKLAQSLPGIVSCQTPLYDVLGCFVYKYYGILSRLAPVRPLLENMDLNNDNNRARGITQTVWTFNFQYNSAKRVYFLPH